MTANPLTMHPALVEVVVTGLAVGGDGVGRDAAGRVTFVPGAVPGDEVVARVVEEHPRYARGALEAVTRPSADRCLPPCPEVARGCGGCGLQQLALPAQRRWKRQVVVDVLQRIAGVPDPIVVDGPELAASGFRTTLRTAVEGGRAGFRRARAHDVVTVGGCLVAHPLLEQLLAEGRFGEASEVTMRAGAGTGERLVIVDGPLAEVRVPADVTVIDAVAAREPGAPAIHEVVAGRRWRISPGSFFQTRADGAEALVATVAGELGATIDPATGSPTGGPTGTVVDAYGGVGLLAAAAPAARVVSVESSRASSADAAVNLADREATVVCARFERWRPVPADAVVADPARRGLGAPGAAKVAATGAGLVVLVSCDAGSLGRDTRLLAGHGFRLVRSTVVDLFPHTPHVEVVSRFER